MQYEVKMTDTAQKHMLRLERSEPAAYRKAQCLLKELEDHPRDGTGKPEALRGKRTGQWSRRITDKHRLVYVIYDDKVVVLVLAAVGHYD